MTRCSQKRWKAALCSSLLFCGSSALLAQESVSSASSPNFVAQCAGRNVEPKPTRPNFTVATDTTQCGVVEADYGWSSQWPGGGTRQDFFSGSLRLGLTPRLDLRWGGDNFISSYAGAANVQGTGDNWFGGRYRFHEQSHKVPSLAFSYNVKIPSASPAKGLGSGYVDHAFTLLAGKDFGKFHFDSNLVGTLAGASGGVQHSTVVSLACWRPLSKRLSLVNESYGGTQSLGSPFAVILSGAAYLVTPKFVVDAAFATAVTHDGPGKHVTFGATYALGDMYGWLTPHRDRVRR